MLVRYRKYCKMARTRNDGSEYFETELVYVEEAQKEFVKTMISSLEAYVEHHRAHLWMVRQSKLAIERLKHSGPLAALANQSGISEKALQQALRSSDHSLHLKITDQDIIIKTDFASKVKYGNFHSATCEHPEQGTVCIAVAIHSPKVRTFQKDVTEQTQLPTGLEEVAILDSSKAPQHYRLGERRTVEVQERTLVCDVFAGYSEESGDARFDQTFTRDIVCYYR